MIIQLNKEYTFDGVPHQKTKVVTFSGKLVLIDGDWLSFINDNGDSCFIHGDDILRIRAGE